MKEDLKLIPFSLCDIKKLYELYQDIPKIEIGSSNDLYGITFEEFSIKYKEYLLEETNINLNINTTTKRLILINNDKLIGELAIRTTLNDFWKNKGSQIYYKIRKSERGKNYGNIILFLGLKEAKKLGFNQIRINCNDENIKSKKVIIKNGGIIDIQSYKTNEGTSSSYIIKLGE